MRRYQNRSRVSYQKIPTHVILTLSVAKEKDPSAAEPQPTLPYVILSRRSAAKNLRLRSLRSFAVYAAQDDVAPKRRWTRRFQDVVVQAAQPEILRFAQRL